MTTGAASPRRDVCCARHARVHRRRHTRFGGGSLSHAPDGRYPAPSLACELLEPPVRADYGCGSSNQNGNLSQNGYGRPAGVQLARATARWPWPQRWQRRNGWGLCPGHSGRSDACDTRCGGRRNCSQSPCTDRQLLRRHVGEARASDQPQASRTNYDDVNRGTVARA